MPTGLLVLLVGVICVCAGPRRVAALYERRGDMENKNHGVKDGLRWSVSQQPPTTSPCHSKRRQHPRQRADLMCVSPARTWLLPHRHHWQVQASALLAVPVRGREHPGRRQPALQDRRRLHRAAVVEQESVLAAPGHHPGPRRHPRVEAARAPAPQEGGQDRARGRQAAVRQAGRGHCLMVPGRTYRCQSAMAAGSVTCAWPACLLLAGHRLSGGAVCRSWRRRPRRRRCSGCGPSPQPWASTRPSPHQMSSASSPAVREELHLRGRIGGRRLQRRVT